MSYYPVLSCPVGLSEEYDLSMCLLKYQVGLFAKESCPTKCQSPSPPPPPSSSSSSSFGQAATTGTLSALGSGNKAADATTTTTGHYHQHHVSHIKTANTMATLEEVARIHELTRADTLVYTAAVAIFQHRVRAMERATGFKTCYDPGSARMDAQASAFTPREQRQ